MILSNKDLQGEEEMKRSAKKQKENLSGRDYVLVRRF